MKTSIATVSIPGDLSDKLSAIAKAGFDGVEIFEQDFITFDGSPNDVGKLVADHGLTVDLFQLVQDFEGLEGDDRTRAFDRLERKFDLMQALGAPLLLVSASTNPVAKSGVERIAEDFHDLGERAASRGLRIGYQGLAWGQHVRSSKDAWEVVRQTDHAQVGLILDSFQCLIAGGDLSAIREIPGEHIFHAQISDAPRIEMDLEYLWRHFRCMPGEGDLPILDFARAFLSTGYDGPLSIEIMSDQLRGGIPRVIAMDAQRSLTYLLDRVRRAEPNLPNNIRDRLPSMPGRSRIEGIEFVEFTANDSEAETLGGMLKALGFAPVAEHISKRVTLWRQGNINLVINTEQEGLAHSAYVMHGTCVCDMGLLVSDAGATMERARALGAHVFSQRRGVGELDIPAVRDVGGSVLHFLDTKSELAEVWDKEFRPLEPDETAQINDAGLTRIDHVAQTMNHDELLSWTLFYVAMFDVEKTPVIDVDDPGGIVYSRAIQSREGGLRLTMNGVDTHRTFAGRFVADSFGSSVQHLAFATDDMFATATALASKGFKALPISENYYLDLASRFDLDDAFLKQLADNDLLYDRDETGSYLQLFSVPYGDGFFFEIIQRRDGYNGYGASNASYRTAAQKRLARAPGMPRR
ncbi:MAG: TIM barrel protein [Pseudomonadota bacterium]